MLLAGLLVAVLANPSEDLGLLVEESPAADQRPIELALAIDRQELAAGDPITVTLKLTNPSEKTLRFHADPHRFLSVTTPAGAACSLSAAQVGEGPLVTLAPGQSRVETLTGKVSLGTGQLPRGRQKRDGHTTVRGLFLDFPTYRIFLGPDGGPFDVQATYATMRAVHRSNVVRVRVSRKPRPEARR